MTASLREIAVTASEVADALAASGRSDEALTVETALRAEANDAEWLLGVREALVTTRRSWEQLDSEMREAAATTLADAKRLAIEL